jgi:hypothetical protein
MRLLMSAKSVFKRICSLFSFTVGCVGLFTG